MYKDRVNNWKSIWDSKTLDTIDMHQDEFEIFCKLKKADGLTNTGKI